MPNFYYIIGNVQKKRHFPGDITCPLDCEKRNFLTLRFLKPAENKADVQSVVWNYLFINFIQGSHPVRGQLLFAESCGCFFIAYLRLFR